MLGGEWFNELGEDPDILRIALEALKDHMGVTDEPSNAVARIHRVCLFANDLLSVTLL